MLPKEKAKELIKKFSELEKYNESEYACFNTNLSKQCALILLNEILENGGNYQGMSFGDNEMFIDRQYWDNVKAELERM